MSCRSSPPVSRRSSNDDSCPGAAPPQPIIGLSPERSRAPLMTTWLNGLEWLAVLRIGLGLWWLESWRHKDKKGWFQRGTGIAWAKSVADKHKWSFVRTGFNKVVAPRPKQM